MCFGVGDFLGFDNEHVECPLGSFRIGLSLGYNQQNDITRFNVPKLLCSYILTVAYTVQ